MIDMVIRIAAFAVVLVLGYVTGCISGILIEKKEANKFTGKRRD